MRSLTAVTGCLACGGMAASLTTSAVPGYPWPARTSTHVNALGQYGFTQPPRPGLPDATPERL